MAKNVDVKLNLAALRKLLERAPEVEVRIPMDEGAAPELTQEQLKVAWRELARLIK